MVFRYLFSNLLVLAMAAVVHRAAEADNLVMSKAAYYPNSDTRGIEFGACEFGEFGATINGGDVTAASTLYRDGVGCGACFQVKCIEGKYCNEKGVKVVITDHGAGDQTDFILSRHAFTRMAHNDSAALSLLSLGVVDVLYLRVSCDYGGKNMMLKVDESSNNPNYFAFVIWYQQGISDITVVQVCETKSFGCKLVERSHGAVWTIVEPPVGDLRLGMLLSGEVDGEEGWLVSTHVVPHDWNPGNLYDLGVQVPYS